MDLTKQEILFDISLKRIKAFNILKQYLIIILILRPFFKLKTKIKTNASDNILADILI